MERTSLCWISVIRATESWALHRHRRGQGCSPILVWIFSGPFSRYYLSSSHNCGRGSWNENWSQPAVQMHEFCVFSSQKERQTKLERKRVQSVLNTVTMLLVELNFDVSFESTITVVFVSIIFRGKQFHQALELFASFKRGLCGGVKVRLGRLQVSGVVHRHNLFKSLVCLCAFANSQCQRPNV